MEEQYFIGIVPTEKYLKQIQHLQKRWMNHVGVEPHITLKAQGGLTPDKKWIDKIQQVCKNFKAFPLSLDKATYFGDNILYLSVHSTELYSLHRSIVEAVSPSADLIKQYFELDDFVPHLTLGKEQYGLSKQTLKEMEKLSTIELTPYPTFDVTFIRIYRFNSEKRSYDPYMDIPLGT